MVMGVSQSIDANADPGSMAADDEESHLDLIITRLPDAHDGRWDTFAIFTHGCNIYLSTRFPIWFRLLGNYTATVCDTHKDSVMESIAYAEICMQERPCVKKKKDVAAGFSIFPRDGWRLKPFDGLSATDSIFLPVLMENDERCEKKGKCCVSSILGKEEE